MRKSIFSHAAKRRPARRRAPQGFTLVELAIVITIIGLLIGGVLKGQEMIQNARITATIAQVSGYVAALETFRDRFDQIPGDFSVARQRLQNCSAASFCFNGNGNNVIGVQNYAWTNVASEIDSENVQFWKHLALADLIAGVSPQSTDQIAWGRTHPSAPISGGFHARHARQQGTSCTGVNSSCLSGLVLVLRNQLDGTWNHSSSTDQNYAISPRHAVVIDRKMDDGVAVTGYVHAISHSYMNGCGQPGHGINGPNGYDETMNRNYCDMFFKM